MSLERMKVVANATKSVPTEVKKGGKTYLVSDAVLINEGVLPGSNGPMLYRKEDMEKNPSDWDNVPIILDHAYDEQGNPISANSMEIIAEQGLGFLANTRVEDSLLKSKLWFDVSLLKRVSGLYQKIKRGDKIELSTGLYSDELQEKGEFNGVAYDSIAVNYRPDHLAILINKKGACGIGNGCGVNVNSKDENDDGLFKRFVDALRSLIPGMAETDAKLIDNDTSHDQLRMNLSDALKSSRSQSQPYCYIYEVYDKYFIYEEMGNLWRQDYTMNSEDLPEFKGKPKVVRREISYVTNSNDEGENMKLTKEQKIAKVEYIIANCAAWKRQGDKEILNNLPDDKILDIEKDAVKEANQTKVAEAAKAGFTAEQTNELGKLIESGIKAALQDSEGKMPWEKVKPAETTPVVTAPAATSVTANEYLAAAPTEIRQAIQTSMQINQQHKDQLINKIIGNEQDQAKKKAHYERLNLKTIDELGYIASLIPQPVLNSPFGQVVPNFLGAGVTANGGQEVYEQDDDDVLPLPKMDYSQN